MQQSSNTLYRLYISTPLAIGEITLSKEASHYLGTVLRKKQGDALCLFHETSGEYLAVIKGGMRSALVVDVQERLRPPITPEGPTLLFSPLKHEALLFLLEKATELGVNVLQPVLCDRTVVRQFSVEKALKRVIEAAEQSERLTIPRVLPLKSLKEAINQLEAPHLLWGAVERSEDGITPQNSSFGAAPVFLVGPEGGFTQEEKNYFKTLPFFRPLTLGDSILRAETAALSLLSFYHISKISSKNAN